MGPTKKNIEIQYPLWGSQNNKNRIKTLEIGLP